MKKMNKKEMLEVLKKAKKIKAWNYSSSLNPFFGRWQRVTKRKIEDLVSLFSEKAMLVKFELDGEEYILCNDARLSILVER